MERVRGGMSLGEVWCGGLWMGVVGGSAPDGPSHYRPSKSNNHIAMPSDNDSELADTYTPYTYEFIQYRCKIQPERCFFKAKHKASSRRNSLMNETVKLLECLK